MQRLRQGKELDRTHDRNCGHCPLLQVKKSTVFQGLDLPPSAGGMSKGQNPPCNNCLKSQGQTTDLSNWHVIGGSSLSKIHWKMEIYTAFLLWVFGLT
jgi:hypothetical protein